VAAHGSSISGPLLWLSCHPCAIMPARASPVINHSTAILCPLVSRFVSRQSRPLKPLFSSKCRWLCRRGGSIRTSGAVAW
jgi:hypothetical protein